MSCGGIEPGDCNDLVLYWLRQCMLSVCTTMIWNISFEIFSRLLAYTLTSMIELGESKLIACTTWIYSWCFCANDLCVRADWFIWLHKPAARLSDCSSFCSKPQHWSDLNYLLLLEHCDMMWSLDIYSWHNTEFIWPLTYVWIIYSLPHYPLTVF